MGAGELAATALPGPLRISTSPSALLFAPLLGTALTASLLRWPLVSLFSFSSLFGWLFSLEELFSAEAAAESSEGGCDTILGGAFQRGISQTTPVKLFSWKPPLCQRRQGAPERSRARRPALIAPWLALGPSLCAAAPALPVALGSIVPSSL